MSNSHQAKVQKDVRDYRRFIEESFPVKEVGEASSREKNIRHGHISTMHIWWARRPLAASRATTYAALTPEPKSTEEWQKKRDFIIQLCQWENSNNQSLLERAREEILEANGGVPPKVLDPFAGGGSYPLEALRLGCEAYANDYNPVAVLIEKATLEYPQKFGRPFEGMPLWAKPQVGSMIEEDNKKKDEDKQPTLFDSTIDIGSSSYNPLINALHYWAEWVLDEARKELAEFYPLDPDGSIPVGYIWARTIPCQNPVCGEEIPLMRHFWLAKKDKKKIALKITKSGKKLTYKIVGNGYAEWPDGFNADKGTVSQAVAECPICNSIIDDDTTRKLFRDGKSGQKQLVVILKNKKGGKKYRLSTLEDTEIYVKAQKYLETKQGELIQEWGIDPVPDEAIHTPTNTEYIAGGILYNFTPILLYGLTKWGDLFNSRQKLALITFSQKVRQAYLLITKSCSQIEFSRAVGTYLGLGVDELARFTSYLNTWKVDAEAIVHIFGRQALPMLLDYNENNPIGDHGGTWANRSREMLDVIDNLSKIPNYGIVSHQSATDISFEDNSLDAVFTDPPYYDNVPYSDLSDFFYVWLKRTIGVIHPDLFSTPLTPKKMEAIAELPLLRGIGKQEAIKILPNIKTSDQFEQLLNQSFKEVYRVLKPFGISIFVYAHKSIEGWETVIDAILDSKLVVIAAWPISTEMEGRLRARESAALASSIYIVARKKTREPTGFYNDVRQELQNHLNTKLHRLWEEGIGGADFFIAAIGSAIEVFGKYEQVMDFEGNIVRANRLLEEVRMIATNYAVKQILHDEFVTEVSPMTRFYVLWRWNYGDALVPFDEANKLAHSCGVDLSLQFGKNGYIKKEKEFARLLGPQSRKLDALDDPRDMIDVLHKTLLLWEKGLHAEMVKTLSDRGFGRSEAFYRVAQAISETLPMESKEKKLLDGFLAGRDRVQQEVEKSAEQGKLL